jgi:excisionase family DNA binding protein
MTTRWGPTKEREDAMEEKLLYTLADVAAALSVSRSKVYELVRSGALPSVRIGGSRRVRGEDLATYVDSLELVPATARVGGW